jgi:uncharacterized linocin/CFP29 family protein
MDRNSTGPDWSDEQWNRVTQTVQETAQKTRIAAQFLPVNLQPDVTAVAVPDRTLNYNLLASAAPTRRLTVDSTPATFVTSLAVNVALTSQEAADPDLSAALIQFRRAASIIARLEDALVFCGQPGPGIAPPGLGGLPQVFDIGAGGAQPGLVALPNDFLPDPLPCFPRQDLKVPSSKEPGGMLASRIIDAIGRLETAGYSAPFACVLGQRLYSDLHTPSSSLVLPRDRVMPFLEGPLLRSSTIPDQLGIVVALGGVTTEIVVSAELGVKFLQTTTEPRNVFRVSERIALRVSDWGSILVLHPSQREDH